MELNELIFLGSNKYGQGGLGEAYQGNTISQPVRFHLQRFIKQISCGANHSALLTIDGLIYTMGSNLNGVLGAPNSLLSYSFNPRLLQGLSNVEEVSCGYYHMCALSEGKIYSWGKGVDGQLGLGDVKATSDPQLVLGIEQDIKAVSCGLNHTLVLASSGSVYAFGNGVYGQLGTGTNRNFLTPKRIKVQRVVSVTAGQNISLLMSGGKLFACGDNTNGQVSPGLAKNYVLQPIKVEGDYFQTQELQSAQAARYCAAISHKGTVYLWGLANGTQITPIEHFRPIKRVALTKERVYLVDCDDELLAFDIIQRCLTSYGRISSSILDIASGQNHLFLLGDIFTNQECDRQSIQPLKQLQAIEMPFCGQRSPSSSGSSIHEEHLRRRPSESSLRLSIDSSNLRCIPHNSHSQQLGTFRVIEQLGPHSQSLSMEYNCQEADAQSNIAKSKITAVTVTATPPRPPKRKRMQEDGANFGRPFAGKENITVQKSDKTMIASNRALRVEVSELHKRVSELQECLSHKEQEIDTHRFIISGLMKKCQEAGIEVDFK